MSATPPSFNTTPTRNSGLGYITSIVHQSPFGVVNKWGMPTVAIAFTPVVVVTFTHAAAIALTPSPYILLQAITSTPIYTMEVNRFFKRIESSVEG
jgi:hypothetical protein